MLRVETQPPPEWGTKRIEDPPLLATPDGAVISDAVAWEDQRKRLEDDWLAYLGSPPFAPPALDVRVVRDYEDGLHFGRLLAMRMEPEYWEQCYLMMPRLSTGARMPAVVVFYYDVDTPAGQFMGSPRWKEGMETRHFARHLVARGYVAIVQRWHYEGVIDQRTAAPSLATRYAPAVARQRSKAPGWKGMGRVVWDARRVVDYLHTLDIVDTDRIACMGHSLGGKMAFYAAAFDRRIRAAIGSDFGIGLSFSNWDAPWYLGSEIREGSFARDHHQLLALIAPRPFLLIAGEDADGDKSWPYLNAAREVYGLYGAEAELAMINHRSGHAPTTEALNLAYKWLDEKMDHVPP